MWSSLPYVCFLEFPSDSLHSFSRKAFSRQAYDHDKQHIIGAKVGNLQLDGWSQASPLNQVLARGFGINLSHLVYYVSEVWERSRSSPTFKWHIVAQSNTKFTGLILGAQEPSCDAVFPRFSMADFLRGRIRIAKCAPWSSWLVMACRWRLLVGNL